ncbi:MAG TPA: DivIVA domain-containing protein [Acidimicrobiales bacterium]|nr:DivIVA domain-containing protein [Acidimicrobiales bacterium]
MDSAKTGGQTSSLDSLRTVEFRQTLRGYHIDDVDEYLERVAVDAEALQEQLRQAAERLKQAAERITQLESALGEAQHQQPVQVTQADDSLQRTLILAQKFVDQTQAEAETQARVLVAEAEDRARMVLADAEKRAKSVTEDTERKLREDVARLEALRTQLSGEVDTVARHLDNERMRLRGALSEMLAWVDEHVQPAATLMSQRSSARSAPRQDDVSPAGGAPPAPSPQPSASDEARDAGPAMVVEGSAGRPAVPVQGNSATGAPRPGMMAAPGLSDAPGSLPFDGSGPASTH